MGRSPCCEKMGLKKGPWTPEEDRILINFIRLHGHPNWRALPKQAGLLRCGKSCRLRWINYLRPDIKRGNFTLEEEETIIKLHQELGNRWSTIAARLPGRTDNEIKNVWHTHLKQRLPQTNNPSTNDPKPAKQTKKQTRKPRMAKKDGAFKMSKIEKGINCMQQDNNIYNNDNDNNSFDDDSIQHSNTNMSSHTTSPQPCNSSIEMSTVTGGSEFNCDNRSMGNVVDGGDYFGELLQVDCDFLTSILPCIEDTAVSTLDFPIVPENPFNHSMSSDLLMIEPQCLEHTYENDMDFFWYHLLLRSNELTESSPPVL